MDAKISVVIPCFNEEKKIGSCLGSLLRQSVHPHEIIVVDGGSKDRTRDVVEAYRKRNKSIKLLVESRKRSPANARNMGWKIATGDYVLFLDADWKFEKSFIESVEKSVLGKDIGKKLLINYPTIGSAEGIFRRYFWYGRTMLNYLIKNKTDIRTLFRILLSSGIIILPFFCWNVLALYVLLINMFLIFCIGLKNGITCYENSGISSSLLMIPLYVFFVSISTGLGLVSMPFLMLIGKYNIGR